MSAACSKLGLARSSHISLPLSTSICPSFLLIHCFPCPFLCLFFHFLRLHIPLHTPIKPHAQVVENLHLLHFLPIDPPSFTPTAMVLLLLVLKIPLHTVPSCLTSLVVLTESLPVTLYQEHKTMLHTSNPPLSPQDRLLPASQALPLHRCV